MGPTSSTPVAQTSGCRNPGYPGKTDLGEESPRSLTTTQASLSTLGCHLETESCAITPLTLSHREGASHPGMPRPGNRSSFRISAVSERGVSSGHQAAKINITGANEKQEGIYVTESPRKRFAIKKEGTQTNNYSSMSLVAKCTQTK